MSRRRGEFEHRTSLFEGAYRAWSYLGGLEPNEFENLPLSQLDPVDHPHENDPRESLEEQLPDDELSSPEAKKAASSEVEQPDDTKVARNVDGSKRRTYPYEPLPRSGLAHPYVRAILKAWLGPIEQHDQDATRVGLTTLRTWWQHRRKGESSTAITFLGTQTMRDVVDGYSRLFFRLAYALILSNQQQPPRTLNKKAKKRWATGVNTIVDKSIPRHQTAEENIQTMLVALQKVGEITMFEKHDNANNITADHQQQRASAIIEAGGASKNGSQNATIGSTAISIVDHSSSSASSPAISLMTTTHPTKHHPYEYYCIATKKQQQPHAEIMTNTPITTTTTTNNNNDDAPPNATTNDATYQVQASAEIAQLRLQVGNQVNAICNEYPSLANLWQMLDERHEQKESNTAAADDDVSNMPDPKKYKTDKSSISKDSILQLQEIKSLQEHVDFQRQILGIQSLQTILHERLDQSEQRYAAALKETNRLEELQLFNTTLSPEKYQKIMVLMEEQKRLVEQLEGTMEHISTEIRQNEEQIQYRILMMDRRICSSSRNTTTALENVTTATTTVAG
eukprot:CAMPEP_0194221838 /NCGR_PEP_ID=MMETSP0156-20130528/31470_1 /TAXON_ID=33649 /ORGANISM="Thalassionema nitzschioides, Strain L26-B" /LENGTH=566 /DNA_ID=CAMNT_0038952379 /DNA_START=80 /DNA_END=1777 /DNA_ORIENTATION=+